MRHRKRPLGLGAHGQVQSWLHDKLQGVAGQIMICQDEGKRIRITVSVKVNFKDNYQFRVGWVKVGLSVQWQDQYEGNVISRSS